MDSFDGQDIESFPTSVRLTLYHWHTRHSSDAAMKPPSLRLALLASVLLLAGCQNSFRDSYKAVLVSPNLTLGQYSGETRAQYSGDLSADFTALTDRWYVPLGVSSFQARTTEELAQWVAEGQVKKQGNAVGADIVLWSDKFLGSAKEMLPRTEAQTSIFDTTEDRYGLRSTTMTPVMGSVEMVPVTVKRYDYTAIYLRKAIGYVCGLGYSNLPDSMFPSIRRNPGARITHVIPDTPASKAGMRVGDIVVRVNDHVIDSSATLSSVINGTRGQTDTFIVIRNGAQTALTVALNP